MLPQKQNPQMAGCEVRCVISGGDCSQVLVVRGGRAEREAAGAVTHTGGRILHSNRWMETQTHTQTHTHRNSQMRSYLSMSLNNPRRLPFLILSPGAVHQPSYIQVVEQVSAPPCCNTLLLKHIINSLRGWNIHQLTSSTACADSGNQMLRQPSKLQPCNW